MMDVSGQLHAFAPLCLEKDPPEPTQWETGWAPNPVWTWWWRNRIGFW